MRGSGPSRSRVRAVLALLLLVLASGTALGLAVYWESPIERVQALRGAPRSSVEAEPVSFGDIERQAFRLTTTGNLQVELMLHRSSQPEAPLLIAGGEGLEVSLPGTWLREVSLAIISEPTVTDSPLPIGLLRQRERNDRRAAALLAAADFLTARSPVREVHFAGRNDWDSPTCVAAGVAGKLAGHWILDPLPPGRVGLGDGSWLEHRLATGGHRAIPAGTPFEVSSPGRAPLASVVALISGTGLQGPESGTSATNQ